TSSRSFHCLNSSLMVIFCFFFQAEDGIRDFHVTGVQTCALPISELAAGDLQRVYGLDGRRWRVSSLEPVGTELLRVEAREVVADDNMRPVVCFPRLS